MSKPKYRITTKFPFYNGVFPITGYFVQRLEEGFFSDKWHDVKGFGRLKDAEDLLKILSKMTDLEKAIELARKHEELYGIRNHEECCVAACQEMAEWKEREMIKKAVDWLQSHANDFMPASYSLQKYDTNLLLYYFKRAMKGEEE